MITSLKIIIFDGSFETTTFIRRLMTGLVKRGHKITVIGFNEFNPHPVSGVYYHALGSNQSRLKLVATSLTWSLKQGSLVQVYKTLKHIFKGNRKQLQEQNLASVLKKVKPDILHIQWPSLLPWIEPYLKNKDFKIVLSQRGFHITVRPFVNPENFKYLKQIYPQLDGLHSVSKAISKLSRSIGVPYTGIDQVVYTGLNFKALPFKLKTCKNIPLQLVSVGRLHWIKDYSTAIRACAILKEQGLDVHYTIIGGKGDEELLYIVHELGLVQQVSLMGRLEQKEVFNRIQDADILLMTSIEEGLANVVVEAMALGTPVISTDCGGMHELVTNGENGWLVPVGNPKAIAECIIMVQNLSLDKLHAITKSARTKVKEQHSETKMVSDMEKLYESIMTS